MDSKIFMYLEPDDISTDGLKLLWFIRQHPALSSKWTSFLTFFSIFMCCVFIALATKGILVSYDNDIFLMCECLQTWILMAHIITKALTLHVYKRSIVELLKRKTQFWKIAHIKQNTLYAECSRTISISKNIMRLYFSLAVVVTILFDLQPLMTGRLPTGCYVPEGWFNFLTAILWYLSYFALLVINGTDGLVCSSVTSLIVQFKLLANRFENMTFSISSSNEMWREIKELVDYHDFLLSFCGHLNFVFGCVFLLQFAMTIASSSVSVFIFLQPGPWSNRIKFILYFLAIMTETSFYCVPLEIAINTASEIDNAVYESKWYEINSLQLRKSLSLVINRTQKTLTFSGYGLINMNLRTYVLICKTIFTFYTYLNSARKVTMT